MPLTIANSTRLAAFLLAAITCAAEAQQYTPPPPPLTTAPCKPTRKDPCDVPASDTRPATVANPFPFPGEKPNAPDIPTADTPQKPAATPAAPGSFPYPGEPSETKPAAPAAPGAFPYPGEPGSSSSSSSSSSRNPNDPDMPADPETPALKDEGSTGSTRFARRHLAKVNAEDPDSREAKDLEVSHYYVTTGNIQAAYLRAKDAVTIIPDDPAAHLALAETAQRLKKNDEAIAEYRATLKYDPDENQIKAARKALAALSPK